MKRLRGIKSSLLARYTFYSFLVFFLPFLILGSFSYGQSLRRAEEGIQNMMTGELLQVQRQFEELIGGLTNIGARINVNQSLSSFMMSHPFHGIGGADLLDSYIAGTEAVSEIILHYFIDSERFYTSRGTFGPEVLYDTFFKGGGRGAHHLFDTSERQLIRLQRADLAFSMQYFVPLLDSSGSQFGTVAFLFDMAALNRIFPINSEARFFVVDGLGEVVFGNYPEFLEGDGYRVTELVSESLGLTFFSVTDSDYLFSFLRDTRVLMIQTLAALFIFGLLTAGLISYLQYLPIKKLHSSLEDEKAQEGNELEQISEKISSMVQRTRVLQELGDTHAILRLIEEEGGGETAFTASLQERGTHFFLILIKGEQKSKDCWDKIGALFPLVTKDLEAYWFQIPLQKKYGILVSHQSEAKASVEVIRHYLGELGEGVSLHYGRSYKELRMVKHSYIEAMIACDYLPGTECEEDIPYRVAAYENTGFIPYPQDLETKLIQSIQQGSADVAQDSLGEIFAFMKQYQHSTDEIRVYGYYLIQRLATTASVIGFSKEHFKLKPLLEGRDLFSLNKQLRALIINMTEMVHQKRDLVRHEFYEEIFSTIREEFLSPDLSLEYLAEKYDYSVSYLSKIIKEELGITFTKYIAELRMEFIKKKLVESDMPIKDIITQSGYYDVSNFSRTFKKKLGVTPGQYRTMNQAPLPSSNYGKTAKDMVE